MSEVLFFEIDGPAAFATICEQYGNALCVDESFWEAKCDSRFATLLPIADLQILPAPIPVHMKNRQSWLIYPHE